MTTTDKNVLDLSAITPDMYSAVGTTVRRFHREMRTGIPLVPVTQEDRDKLGGIRQKRLRMVCMGSLLMLVVAVAAIVIGVMSIITGKQFPYFVGGGIIGGVPCLIVALIGLWMVFEGKKMPTGDVTTSKFQNITGFSLCLFPFALLLLINGIVLGGLWPSIECLLRPPTKKPKKGSPVQYWEEEQRGVPFDGYWTPDGEEEDDNDAGDTNKCTPNPDTLLTLGLLTTVSLGLLILICIVTFFFIVCKQRAFGIKTNYELLLELQQARLHAGTQQPMGMHGGKTMYGEQEMQPMMPQNQTYQQ